jgi:hypothetical protein
MFVLGIFQLIYRKWIHRLFVLWVLKPHRNCKLFAPYHLRWSGELIYPAATSFWMQFMNFNKKLNFFISTEPICDALSILTIAWMNWFWVIVHRKWDLIEFHLWHNGRIGTRRRRHILSKNIIAETKIDIQIKFIYTHSVCKKHNKYCQ